MEKPEWGIFPKETEPKLFWGARGVIVYSRFDQKRRLDLYSDRQSFCMEDEAEGKEEFVDWINHELIPLLETKVRRYDTAHIECASANGKYHAIAEDRSSGGYLYIGAWAS